MVGFSLFSLACSGTRTDVGELSGSGGSGAGSASSGAESESGGTGSDGGDSSSGDGDGDGDDGVRFDVGDGGDSGGDGGGGGPCSCGESEWSYAWIANSDEATVSKINTRTMVEEGRYATGGVSPSRTSVSVDSRAAVVANRGVGLAKFWALPEFCEDKNGNGTIETSTGPMDVLPFGEDECLDWFLDFPDMSNQRPVAWTQGTRNPSTCEFENQKIWTVTGYGGDPTRCTGSTVWVHLIDGATGTIDQSIEVNHHFGCDVLGLGPYGGAVDYLGNFYFHGFGGRKFARVDFATKEVTLADGGGYGTTVDTEGRVWWTSYAVRHDPVTGQTQSAGATTSGGIAEDLTGRMWGAQDGNVVWIDMETMAVGDTVEIPGDFVTKGVSVDLDGFIWVTRQEDPTVYKIDPDTYAIETYTGLNNPYTYSDMTGGQITRVTCDPPVG